MFEGSEATNTTESHDTGTQAANNAAESAGSLGAASTENEAQAEKTEDPARTEPAAAQTEQPVAAVRTGIEPGSRRRNLFMIDLGEPGRYHPTEEDASHGITAGEVCAAIVVKINQDAGTVNLHVYAPDSATVLFKANVDIGAGPGLFHL